MKTTARSDGEDFVINGSKMWISNADIADVFIVFANLDPSKGYRGITAFILDRSLPGLTVGPSEKKLGLRACGTCPVHLENVRVSYLFLFLLMVDSLRFVPTSSAVLSPIR